MRNEYLYKYLRFLMFVWVKIMLFTFCCLHLSSRLYRNRKLVARKGLWSIGIKRMYLLKGGGTMFYRQKTKGVSA